MTEQDIQNLIRIELSESTEAKIFRNNTGRLKQGNRIVHFGLCRGSSDLIGWTPVEITPEMVGQTVAVFTAVEVKTPKGRATKEQKNFIEQVRSAGGLAGVARSAEEAKQIILNKNFTF